MPVVLGSTFALVWIFLVMGGAVVVGLAWWLLGLDVSASNLLITVLVLMLLVGSYFASALELDVKRLTAALREVERVLSDD